MTCTNSRELFEEDNLHARCATRCQRIMTDPQADANAAAPDAVHSCLPYCAVLQHRYQHHRQLPTVP